MTRRALTIGALLALFICSFTYYNNQILRQTFFVSNHFPVAVFGTLVVLVFLVRPLLLRWRPKSALQGRELAIIAAMGLAVCCWPDVNGFRAFVTNLTFGTHWYKTNAGWQGARVMEYVPGGSPLFAQGYIKDFCQLRDRLRAAQNGPEGTPATIVVQKLSDATKRSLASNECPLSQSEERSLVSALNKLIENPTLHRDLNMVVQKHPAELAELSRALQLAQQETAQWEAKVKGFPESVAQKEHRLALYHLGSARAQEEVARHRLHRHLLTLTFPQLLVPAPEGSGVLVNDGHEDAFAIDTLVRGWGGTERLGITDLPWSTWWPSLRLWGSIAILVVLASLCMALIVHPQWSKRERLPYPIVGFVRDLTGESKPHGSPALWRNRLFWAGVLAPLALNFINGLHAWFPAVPEIPRNLDFSPLSQLFPSMQQVGWITGYVFHFTIFPIAFAFAYLIRSDVSLALGLSGIAWAILGAILLSQGVALGDGDLGWRGDELLRLGAGIGLAAFIIFAGRKYYFSVVRRCVGLSRGDQMPPYVIWAARGLVACVTLAVLILQAFAGVHWVYGMVLIGSVLLGMLIMSRLNAEGGVFFLATGWHPAALLPAFFGFSAIAPPQMFALAVLGGVIASDWRGAAMPYFVNAVHLTDGVAKTEPRRMTPWFVGLVVLGFGVTLLVTMYFQYNLSANPADQWARNLPSRFFEGTTRQISVLAARAELSDVMAMSDWERLAETSPDDAAMGWLLVGLVSVSLCALARVRWSWWPVHPILFVVIGLWHVVVFAPSFLIGLVVRGTVINVGGARAYQVVKPVMIGIIAGELLSIVFWSAIGAIYYSITGLTPPVFAILPN